MPVDDKRTKQLTLGAMCFALFMVMLDNTVVNVALPAIQLDLGSGVAGLQWIVNGYALVFASLLLTGGTLGDIFGRKRLFLIGLVVFTVGSVLCGVAPTVSTLIAGRVVQGIGAAALMPGSLSILTNTFPDPRERAQAIGVWTGVSAMALALGPVLGGILVDTLGWQSVFFVNLPVGIVAFFVASRFAPASADPAGRRIDVSGQVLGVAFLGSLTYALIEGNGRGWRSPLIVTLLVVAVVALVAFLVVELRSASPMLQLHFFRNPTFTASNLVAFLVSFGMFGTFFFMSLYFQHPALKGYTAVQTGLRILPNTIAIIVVAPIAGRLAGRYGPRPPMVAGMLLAGTGLYLFHDLTATMSYGAIWWRMVLLGTGMGLTMTPMTAAVMGSVPPARAGMASAVVNTSRQVGGVFGVALLGAVVTSRFTASLGAALDRLAVPADTQAAILRGAGAGGEGSAVAIDAVPPPVLAAVGDAFVGGMRLAYVVAALCLATGAIVAAAFVRSRASSDVPAPELATAAAG